MYGGRDQEDGFSGNLSMSLKILNIFGYGEINVTSKKVSDWLGSKIGTSSKELIDMHHRYWLKRKRNPDPHVKNGYVYNLRQDGLEVLAWMEKNDLPRPCCYTEQYLLELADKNGIKFH